MSSLAVFLLLGGGMAVAAGGLGKNTVGTKQLKKNAVTAEKVKDGSLLGADFAPGQIPAGPAGAKGATGATGPTGPAGVVGPNSVNSANVVDESLTAADLGPNSVASSEVAENSIGSSEISAGVVGADELDSIHEHFGTETNITDVTAHDGAYSIGSATVSCGLGEDLLSVSVDWTNTGGHNERHFEGVSEIDRSVDPETATVEVSYDGGAAAATWRPVATCIF